jgi:Protein of unknown function (DUF2934)
MDKEQQVREMAYRLWVAEGRPHGRHEEHWLQAKKLVSEAGNGPVPQSRPPSKRMTPAGRASSARTTASSRKTSPARD